MSPEQTLLGILGGHMRKIARQEMRSIENRVRENNRAIRKGMSRIHRELSLAQKSLASMHKIIGEKASSNNHAPAPKQDVGRFSPAWVKRHRGLLDMSAQAYGQLVGVSALTIYHWEHGKSRPRPQQFKQWYAIRHLGKTEAWDKLSAAQKNWKKK